MLEVIWGLKTIAIFDVWTFEHLLSGLSVGSAVHKKNHKEMRKFFRTIGTVIRTGEYRKLKKLLKREKHHSLHFDIMGVLCLAFAWETIEHYLEQGLLGERVMYWFQGTEFWANRIISDPLMLVLGYLIAKRYPRLVVPARILSFVWLIFHIFIDPHSMWLHEIL
ncbi:hypothetical protein C0581_02675 [Candidatus Parcubacteria bacterium]|nr:MAG: hypothetical protein C0581_02675 [Candidatus Parcubacteria bacterium]